VLLSVSADEISQASSKRLKDDVTDETMHRQQQSSKSQCVDATNSPLYHAKRLVCSKPQQDVNAHQYESAPPLAPVELPIDANTTALDNSSIPSAQARQWLGEIADADTLGPSGQPASQLAGFFAWGMPPIKRGFSLADTRDATGNNASALCDTHEEDERLPHAQSNNSLSFLDDVLV